MQFAHSIFGQLIIFTYCIRFDSLLHSFFLLQIFCSFCFVVLSGKVADNELEKKISHITFHHHIDGEETVKILNN